MTGIRQLLCCALALAFCAGSASGGAGNRTGTNGASELLIPVGARDIALGGSTTATSKGIEALFWNPAGTAGTRNASELYFSHMNYMADMAVNYGAVSANFDGVGVLSLSLKALAIDDIAVTTTTDPDGTGQTFQAQFLTVGLSFARQLSDRIAVGFTAHLISETMGDVNATGFAFDIGVRYENLASINGLSIGIVVKNIGPSMQYGGSGLLVQGSVADQNRPAQYYQVQAAPFEIPTSIDFGLGYRRDLDGSNAVQVTGAFQSNNFLDDEYSVGAEYSYQDLFFLRGGWALTQTVSDEQGSLYGPTFGAGVHTALGSLDLAVDYAYRSMKVFEPNHIFSVRLGF
jgi:hypothetical protein